ncbi:recombinase family protein [Pseudanabaena sp. FACHB-2040]|uniref:recombinase family protein n=1 Tax=Pseudanabaena sp. FACHB-2040 TaxID=2692859 RepID=UPI0032205A42
MSQQLLFDGQGRRFDKICPHHLDRLAVVYVRQSTMQQVVEHQESTRLQYGLVDRAIALGWTRERILVIDEDLGKSATSIEGRLGFQQLVAEVSLDHVGLILGLDISRLARPRIGISSSKFVRSSKASSATSTGFTTPVTITIACCWD